MIPLFCFFPSLAAKLKKKETAKAVSLRPSKKWQSRFFDSLLFSYAQQSYPPPFEGGYNAMLLCGAVAKLVQPAVSQRQYQIRGYHYEIQYVNYDHIGYASADQLAR